MHHPHLILAAILAAGVFASASSAAETLRVMTFNVRYPAADDGENVWDKRRDLVVETIRRHAPDVVGTQELFALQGDYITRRLPEYAWFGIGRTGTRDDEHMGLFYRKDRLRLRESGNFWLSETPQTPGSMSWNVSLPRMVTWGLFESVRSGRPFYVYNTHFAHRPEDEQARTRSAEVIAGRIRALPADVPLVITGDFNTTPGSAAHRLLTATFGDAWEAGARRSGPESTFHGFTGKPDADRRIDWILFRGFGGPASVKTVTNHRDGTYPSDHFPVVAELELPNGVTDPVWERLQGT